MCADKHSQVTHTERALQATSYARCRLAPACRSAVRSTASVWCFNQWRGGGLLWYNGIINERTKGGRGQRVSNVQTARGGDGNTH